MSRIGKHPVSIPDGVKVALSGQTMTVSGKLGELSRRLPNEVEIKQEDSSITVSPRSSDKRSRAMWGMSRTLVSNMITGVSAGFTRNLVITGVGYRAALDGKVLNLQLGYSHDIKYAIPGEIDVKCATPTQIAISGADRQQVGQIAAEIRAFRKPEPYKGKGIRYDDERIIRKEGKKK